MNFNQKKEEPPQNSDIRQHIREECGIKVCEKQKQNMEDTMLELLEVYRQKEFYCMHNDVDDLIESALNSKLLLINLRSQCLNKKKQESSTSLNNTPQISLVNAIAPVLPTEEPKYSLSMGYENLSATLETKSDEIIKSSVDKLVPIQSEYEGIFDNTSDLPVCKENYEILSDSNNDDTSSDDDAFEDIDINRLIADIEFLNDNPTPDRVLKSSFSFPIFKKSNNSLSYSDNSLPEFETFSDHTEDTRSGSTTAHANNSLPDVVLKYISNNSTNDPLLEEVDLFLALDNSITPGIRNIDYYLEGDIHFLEELLRNDSIPFPKNESSNFDHHDDSSFPRPPLEPPDVKFFFDFEPNSEELIAAVINNIDELIEDECFDPEGGFPHND
nr:hypothetical protein [Tanacetum cinerariifolium]